MNLQSGCRISPSRSGTATVRKNRPPPRRVLRDSTLVAWYRSIYAPRTGGAYDSHHWTAGVACRARRRGVGVAARGARAAAGFWLLSGGVPEAFAARLVG